MRPIFVRVLTGALAITGAAGAIALPTLTLGEATSPPYVFAIPAPPDEVVIMADRLPEPAATLRRTRSAGAATRAPQPCTAPSSHRRRAGAPRQQRPGRGGAEARCPPQAVPGSRPAPAPRLLPLPLPLPHPRLRLRPRLQPDTELAAAPRPPRSLWSCDPSPRRSRRRRAGRDVQAEEAQASQGQVPRTRTTKHDEAASDDAPIDERLRGRAADRTAWSTATTSPTTATAATSRRERHDGEDDHDRGDDDHGQGTTTRDVTAARRVVRTWVDAALPPHQPARARLRRLPPLAAAAAGTAQNGAADGPHARPQGRGRAAGQAQSAPLAASRYAVPSASRTIRSCSSRCAVGYPSLGLARQGRPT